ncbi:MAG: sulfate reduction electron transfer complex DsrMKJOP subunit DsrJ [Fibrobacteria bacterium]|nr:sulfate reduction electron transfer complex DsrMKJOP subunit DsrJ [Fibrobacteria bacterium]
MKLIPSGDKKWIILGLIIFVGLFTFPIWYNMLKCSAPIQPVVLSAKAKAAGYCVLPKSEMVSAHMQILDEWRDIVVREGERTYTSPSGKIFTMSLSNTCLDCHNNQAEFCDRCHQYASVKTYCMDCHVNPSKSLKENMQ